ncbi:MAG: PLP-dependent aminotransferase family protein [Microcoleaceae cyanobacterium]
MNVQPLESAGKVNLYEQVAYRVQCLIEEGTLQPGDRIPSVRKMHRQMNVSISTVLEAYRLLEDRGLVGARPQSGYYVRQSPLIHRDEPAPSAPEQQIRTVDAALSLRINAALHDPKVIKLGAAVPGVSLFPTKALNRLMGQIVRQNPTLCHSYAPIPGCKPLRREIARRMMDAGCSITPDEVLITNGAYEAIHISLRAITQPGDTVAIESPAYYGILEILESLHLKALELPTSPRDGLSLPNLANALEQQNIAACVLVSNFSNPLGSCMTDEKKQQLVEILERYDVPLVEDDIYGELYFEGNRPRAVKAFDRKGLVIYCSSFSKTLSPGLRVGWAIAGRYQEQVKQFKLFTNLGTATPNQLVIAAFLANGGFDRHLRHLRQSYQQQVMRMHQAIYDYFPPETKVTRPPGGHVLWVELPRGFDSVQLYETAYQYRISIAPGSMFSTADDYRHCFRLNCGLPWSAEIQQAMKTLGELVHQQFQLDGSDKLA